MREDRIAGVSRAALYRRVSTDDQAREGLSLDTQHTVLQDYARQNGLRVVDVYTDEGISARKSYKKRPAILRMLEDIKAGEIDVILFIKLDRWFRNIADFYEVQRFLDRYGVQWIATEEDYDTTTSNGRLSLNVRLAVAQDEADRASERVKFVFADKLKRGEVVTGTVPLGLCIQNKKLAVVPEQAEQVRQIYQHYIDTHSIGGTARWAAQLLGRSVSPDFVRHLLTNRRYIGESHGIPGFCPAIIDAETFDRVQELMRQRSPRNSTYQQNIYLFSGLLFCADCGASMHSTCSKGHKYYRCRQSEKYKSCSHDRRVREDYVEDWLLKNLALEMDRHNAQLRAKSKVKAKAVDEAKIRRKMDKLKDLYLNDLIERDAYERDYSQLRRELEEARAVKAERLTEIDIEKAKDLLAVYPTLPDTAKKAFWNRIIKRIDIDAEKSIKITPA